MRFIGLTGGIASGKSTVARLLTDRGAVVVDADQLARQVVLPGTPALEEIVAAFGTGILDATGALDRAALGRAIFADPAQRARLDAITHPRIGALLSEQVAAALAGPAPLVVADIPLLFEGRRQDMFEGTLLAYAPAAVQLRRLADRDGVSEAEARQRLDAQMPIDSKRALATWIIDNGGDRDTTVEAVERWWADHVNG